MPTSTITRTQHVATFDEIEIGEEPVVFIQDAGDWSIDSIDGTNIAKGEEWLENGQRKVAISLLSIGVSAELVRSFVDRQPACSSIPSY